MAQAQASWYFQRPVVSLEHGDEQGEGQERVHVG